MRRLALLAALIAVPAVAQAPYWDWEQPLPTADAFNDVDYSGFYAVDAVGNGGVIYRINLFSSPATASRMASPTAQTLNCISGIPGTGHTYVGGNGGVLLKNFTGTYVAMTSPTTDNIVGISFVDDMNGWFVTSTGFIWYTNNGGVNWTSQARPAGATTLHSVNAINTLNASIGRDTGGGGHSLMKTTNAGSAWTDVASASTPAVNILHVAGKSVTGQVASGPVSLFRYNGSTDAWSPMDAGATPLITDLYVNGTTGWGITAAASGARHLLFSFNTTSGPVAPAVVPAAVPLGLWANGVATNTHDVVVGQGGLIEEDINGPWEMASSGTTGTTLHGMAVAGPNAVVVGGNSGNGYVRLRNNGTWAAEVAIDGGPLYDVALDLGGVQGWGVSSSGVFHTPNVVTTPWSPQNANTTQYLHSVALVPGDAGVLVAGGANGTLRRTTNNGAAWSTPTLTLSDGGSSIDDFVALDFPSASTGYACGYTLYKTTNGGAAWHDLLNLTFEFCQDVSFVNDNLGMALFNFGFGPPGGQPWVTTNGGTSWTQRMLPTPPCSGAPVSVVMGSANVAWVLHSCAGVSVTTDQGVTWSPWSQPWTGVFMNNLATARNGSLKDVWAVGSFGAIMRTKCGGDPSVLACDDGNPCTDDSCNPATGACAHVNNTKPCNDNSVCTQTDTCSGGMCVGSNPVNCNDGNVCTTDSCDPVMGCSNTAVGMSMSCDDGNSCTNNDVCVGSMCQGTGTVCNNGNPCQTGNCGADGGCAYSNKTNGVACTDNNLCTSGDSCQNGTCTGSTVMCGDTNSCTDDSCVPTSGCAHNAHVGSCSTGNLCITGQACSGTSCGGGSAVNCDDNDPCTDDSCAPDAGCAHSFRGVNATCDDGKACTIGDVCIADGGCRGAPNTCSDGNSCTQDLCYEPGGCLNPLLPTGTTCSDGNACTTGDSCSDAGVCAGFGMMCDDQNPCTTDSCSPGLGCVATPLPDHSACNDGNDCNMGDHCETGRCVADAGLNCDDNNPCTVDTCNSGTGGACKYDPRDAGTLCSDNNACTDNDHCTGVLAMGCVGVPLTCDDHNGCTADTCDTVTGCANTNLDAGTVCNDGNACTSNETCDGLGTCLGPQNCTPSDTCMNATCDPDGGQCTMTPKMDPMCMGTGGGGGSGTGGGSAGGGSAATGGGSGATGGGIAQGGGSSAGGTAQGGGTSAGGGEAGGTEKPSIFKPGCGCDGSGGALTLLLALVTLVRRRRPS